MSGRLVVVGRGAPERGGIPSYLAMLVRAEQGLGRPVVLVNLAPPAGSDGGAASWSNLRRTLSDVLRVLRTARRSDIVHVHSALAPTVTALRAGLLLVAARIRGAKVVLHAHGGRLAQQLPQGRRRRLTAAAMRPAHVVVAVAEVVRVALLELGVPAERVRVVSNGVDLEAFDAELAPHAGPPRVLFVGGLTARKGVLDLAAASDDLRERGVDHELWLAGGVPDDGDAAYAEVMSGLPHDARILGAQPPEAMSEVYAQCDVFCLPSWWEAMPLTVLEAQAAGLPVVATAVGDVPRLLVDGETGRVVPARDPEALADALAELLADAALRDRMGHKARENARRFDQRDTISALARLFDELGDAP